MTTSLKQRAQRIEVPLKVRRALTQIGRINSIRLFNISDFNYVEAVSPGGMLQEKTIEKVQRVLAIMDSDASEDES